jgi:hypothetical protein
VISDHDPHPFAPEPQSLHQLLRELLHERYGPPPLHDPPKQRPDTHADIQRHRAELIKANKPATEWEAT